MNEIEKKNSVGRPIIEIDLDMVEKLCSIQCTAEEIAYSLGVSEDTLDLRLKDAGYANFTEFYKKYSSGGKISLRRSQWKSADGGNVTMQIWLGKQHLGQRDKLEELSTETSSVEIIHTVKFKENSTDSDL
jgi:hypothetical protein